MADQTRNLVQDASRGDAVALDALLARYLPELETFVRLRIGRPILARESAADLVQSVCREVLEGIDGIEYRGEAAFKQWLYVASLNKIRRRHRFYGRERRDAKREAADSPSELGLAASATPSRAAIRNEELAGLERALAQLPEDYRVVILLSRFLEMTTAEIAREMERSEGAVRVLLHRAIARLGVLLKWDCENETPTG